MYGLWVRYQLLVVSARILPVGRSKQKQYIDLYHLQMYRQALLFVFLLTSVDLYCQKLFYGVVSDSTTAEGLPLVNVYINNSTIGTTTDSEGKYSLRIPGGQSELVFSFVGYRSYKVSTSDFEDDTVRVVVKLATLSRELEGVTVLGKADVEWKKLSAEFRPYLYAGQSNPDIVRS